MRLDVIRVHGCSDEWCVTVDGTYVVGFAGPGAQHRALQHRDELAELLAATDEHAAVPVRDPKAARTTSA